MLEKINASKLQLASIFVLVVFPLAILATKYGLWHFRLSFLLFLFAAIAAFVVLVISILKLSRGAEGEGRALVVSIILTLIPLFILGMKVVDASKYPFIHDITTDTQTPPTFIAAAKLRGADDHSGAYDGQAIAQIQQESYPSIKPLILEKSPIEIYDQAKALMEQRGWKIASENNKSYPFTLEAVDTSFLFGFKDDIAIRIHPLDTGTQLDMRSMSRQGESDLGVNANRIEAFLTDMSR